MTTNELLALLLRVNLVAAVTVALILVLRPYVTQRFGPRTTYLLWAVAPLAGLASLLPARRTVVEASTVVGALVERRAEAAPLMVPDALVPDAVLVAAPTIDPTAWVLGAWALGAAACFAVLVLRQAAFRCSLGRLSREDGYYRSEAAGVGPAVVGALFPRIVIPADFEARFGPEERRVVLAHEQVHFDRADPIANALMALAQCLAWFNPAVHVAAHYLRLDQELACDAEVVARFPAGRRCYAEAMLKTQLGPMAAAPLACYWPARSAQPMKHRIALLKRPPAAAGRRALGVAAVAALSLGAGVVAWAAQPARIEIAPRTGPQRGLDVMRTNIQVGQAAAEADRTAAETERTAAEVDRRAAELDRTAAEAAAALAGGTPAERAGRLGGQLIEAIDEGYPDSIRTLIRAGADVNHYRPGDGTPLVQAARLGDAQTARLLIRAGADVNKAAPGDGNPLIMAAAHGRLEVMELLVQAGADVNGFVLRDETPLINAARAGDVPAVTYLIERGADPNLAVPSGNRPGEMRSPLSMAANRQVADILRAHGARR